MITRRNSLGLIAGAFALGSCARGSNHKIRIASNSSDENAAIAEIYASALERGRVPVERHMRLGNDMSVMAALEKGDIDLYPGLVRSATKTPRALQGDSDALNDAARPRYRHRYGVTWLAHAPANETSCLLTTPLVAQKYWLLQLTKCAEVAAQLRFAASHEFLAAGALGELQRVYGPFRFKSITAYDQGAQYDALGREDADVADGFTTDPRLVERQFIALRDDKMFWGQRNIAPIVRVDALIAWPSIRPLLDRVSRILTDYAVLEINRRLDLPFMDAREVGEDFVFQHLR